MNGMRKVMCFLLATLLMSFALPSSAAPEKIFALIGVPPTATPGQLMTGVVFTFRNDTPGGNANINSVRLRAPTGWVLSNPQPAPGGDVSGGTGVVEGGGASVAFTNIPGIKTAGKTWKMSVNVQVSSTVNCSNVWGAEAFVGNSLNGDNFRLTNSLASLTTGESSGQATAFTTQPASTTLGSATPVAVTLSSSCGPGSGVLVTIAAPGCTGACLTGNTATTNSSGVASFPALKLNAIGTYTLTATPASGSGYPAANSNSFTVFAGILGCSSFPENNYDSSNGKTNHVYDPYGTGPFVGDPGWGLRRGLNWDTLDVNSCILVNYTFTLDPTNITTFLWDKATLQHPVFEYVIVWNPVAVDASGWTERRPLVSWTTVPDYIPALACVVDDDQIGKAAFPVIPNIPPFDGYPVGHPYHPDGTNQALLCVAQQGWTAVGGGLVQYWDKVLDAADSSVKFP